MKRRVISRPTTFFLHLPSSALPFFPSFGSRLHRSSPSFFFLATTNLTKKADEIHTTHLYSRAGRRCQFVTRTRLYFPLASRLYFCWCWFSRETTRSKNKKVNDLSISGSFFPCFLQGFSSFFGSAVANNSLVPAVFRTTASSPSGLRNNRRRVQTSAAINIV